MNFNVAIDGPSAAGKSSIAKLIAQKYQLIHLDTGAMYRCVAYKAIQNKIDLNDEKSLGIMLQDTKISFDVNGKVFLDGVDVSVAIRDNQISMGSSIVSKLKTVRDDLVERQKLMAAGKGFILDGRDIGTVVLKDAEVKIFMVASEQARANRRYQENLIKGIKTDYQQLVEDIKARDYQDIHRVNSPLTMAPDAIKLDTSNLSIADVVIKVSEIIEEKVKK